MPTTNNPVPPDPRPASQAAVRLFFVDKKAGHPVCGLPVSVLADSPAIANSQRRSVSAVDQRQNLASLQTDQAGYVSFKFDASIMAGRSQLTVSYGATQGEALVLDVADLMAGSDTHTIQIDAAAYANIPRHLALPSIMAPDIRDLTVSPGSVGLTPHLLPGSGLCRQLMPTLMAVRRFEAFLIKANICSLETLICADDVHFARGKMLEYEIVWHPAGTALGDLLNTISLAPCEQVNIAISDWMRQETASQTSATDVQQQSFQEMNHERLITEAMQSSVSTKGSAWGIATATSAKASIPIDAVKLDLTAALSGGYSSTSSTQNVAANVSNQLSERITQAASFVASERSTVVFQATATEQQTYQTRTVRNHNHCHTLTLMYYQVNRNYRVVTDYRGERDVILVKYNNADFDASRVYCYAELLKSALLDQSLLKCFDELGDALFCCELTPVGAPEQLLDSVTITFWVKENNRDAWWFNGVLTTANGSIPLGASAVSLQNWQVGGMYSITIPISPAIDPKLAVSVTLGMAGETGFGHIPIMTFSKIEVTGHVTGLNAPLTLYSSQADTVISGVNFPGWLAWLKADAANPQVNKNECVEKSCGIQKLLGHLNCHKRYYNSILWLNEDPNERVMRWSCCHGRDKEPYSLIAQIENEPIAVYGDFLVFPAAGSQLVITQPVPPVSKLITMPTPGVFSEGILGQCDTCEKIDPDRFWDWTKSPCPDNAPPVAPPPTPQTGAQPGDLKADTISNLITLSNVPDAPDSVIKDLVASLVSKADDGSAEAKDLLGKLLDTIKDSVVKG